VGGVTRALVAQVTSPSFLLVSYCSWELISSFRGRLRVGSCRHPEMARLGSGARGRRMLAIWGMYSLDVNCETKLVKESFMDSPSAPCSRLLGQVATRRGWD
jgi:hypothetical protein